jgi:hypothetical protein
LSNSFTFVVSPLSANRLGIPNIGMSMNIRIAWRRNLFMI